MPSSLSSSFSYSNDVELVININICFANNDHISPFSQCLICHDDDHDHDGIIINNKPASRTCVARLANTSYSQSSQNLKYQQLEASFLHLLRFVYF